MPRPVCMRLMVYLSPLMKQSPDEHCRAVGCAVSDTSNHVALESGPKQTEKFVMKAMAALQG